MIQPYIGSLNTVALMSALNRCKADKRQVTPFEYNPRPTAQERKENEESWQRLSVLIDGCIDHLEDEYDEIWQSHARLVTITL
jgi:hypothetical protein